MEFVYREGLLRQEKQTFFLSSLASSSFQALYAPLLVLYPVFPFVNFVLDTVYQLAAETNSVLLLKQQTLEGPSFLRVVFLLQLLAKPLDVVLEAFQRCCRQEITPSAPMPTFWSHERAQRFTARSIRTQKNNKETPALPQSGRRGRLEYHSLAPCVRAYAQVRPIIDERYARL